jgi:hypothetical protein
MARHCIDTKILTGVRHTEKLFHANAREQSVHEALNRDGDGATGVGLEVSWPPGQSQQDGFTGRLSQAAMRILPCRRNHKRRLRPKVGHRQASKMKTLSGQPDGVFVQGIPGHAAPGRIRYTLGTR